MDVGEFRNDDSFWCTNHVILRDSFIIVVATNSTAINLPLWAVGCVCGGGGGHSPVVE